MPNTTPIPSTEVAPVAISVANMIESNASGPHELECLIQRGLKAHPALKFSRLTVHQCPQGVCLEGMLETNEQGIDLCELVNQIAGVKAINHVVDRPAKPK
jgi:hypothetical protein